MCMDNRNEEKRKKTHAILIKEKISPHCHHIFIRTITDKIVVIFFLADFLLF